MTRIAKLSLSATAAFLVVGLVLLVVLLERIKSVGDLGIEKTAESIAQIDDGSCTWTIDFEIENRTDELVTIHSIRAALQRSSPVNGRVVEEETGPTLPVLRSNEVTPARLTFALNECLADPDDLRHDLLKVVYSLQGTGNRIESKGF